MDAAPTSSSSGDGRQYHPVVEISNGFKHFGVFNNWQTVLQKFNLTAYSGELYILLGPHGCGKTTVLNVILGLTKLNQGSVEVFGFKPGTEGSGIPGMRVGYTPQSLGLYEDFSVSEIIKYYGNLLGMSRGYINERMAFLDILLSLPAKTTYIRHCPETTKRQISFAIALLHEPELLILDEPTAGVDPVLRKSIWEYLWRICSSQNTTIIVTTQQAFEASKSHRIGIMRNGMLIDEGEPKFLQNCYRLRDIDDVYISIYITELSDLKNHRQRVLYDDSGTDVHKVYSEGFLYENSSIDHLSIEKTGRFKSLLLCMNNICNCTLCCCHSFRKLRTLFMKNISFIFRHYVRAFWFVAIPVVLTLIFGVFIGGKPHGVPVCVINRDNIHGRRTTPKIGDLLLELLTEEDIVLIQHKNIDDATADVRNGQCFGLIVIGNDFSKSFSEEIISDPSCSDALDNRNLGCNFITLHPDETSNIITNYIARTLCMLSLELYEKLVQKNLAKTIHVYVYKEGESIHGKESPSVARYLIPGFAVILLSHISAYLSASNLLYIRNNNILVRDYLAGVTFGDLMIHGFITNMILLTIPVVITFLLVNFVFVQCLFCWSSLIGFFILFIQMSLGLAFGCCLGVCLKDCGSLIFLITSSFLLNLLTAGVVSSTWTLPWHLRKFVLYVNPLGLAVKNIRLLASSKILLSWKIMYSVLYPLSWAIVFLIACWIKIFTKSGILRAR